MEHCDVNWENSTYCTQPGTGGWHHCSRHEGGKHVCGCGNKKANYVAHEH